MKAGKTRTKRRAAFKDAVAAIHALESSAHFFARNDLDNTSPSYRIDAVRTARMRLIIAALEVAAHVDGEDKAAVIAAVRAAAK